MVYTVYTEICRNGVELTENFIKSYLENLEPKHEWVKVFEGGRAATRHEESLVFHAKFQLIKIKDTLGIDYDG